ncbi:Lrp/AsnC family transcriptional regulator [Pedobacter steynii]
MEPFKLDQTDIGILRLLQEDGKMPYKELAEKLGKSINPINERIKRLKTEGYISTTVALLDLQKIGGNFIAFPHINLTNHLESTMSLFIAKMVEYPEVMECYHLTGHYDFMLKVVMPGMAHYNAFLKEKITILPYVGNVQSFLALSEVKRTTRYPFL